MRPAPQLAYVQKTCLMVFRYSYCVTCLWLAEARARKRWSSPNLEAIQTALYIEICMTVKKDWAWKRFDDDGCVGSISMMTKGVFCVSQNVIPECTYRGSRSFVSRCSSQKSWLGEQCRNWARGPVHKSPSTDIVKCRLALLFQS